MLEGSMVGCVGWMFDWSRRGIWGSKHLEEACSDVVVRKVLFTCRGMRVRNEDAMVLGPPHKL